MATAEQQAWVWQLARGAGTPKVEPMNPYGFALSRWPGNGRTSPSESLAYWVSREWVQKLPQQNAFWWHLTNAALTIWLTRHWTTDEVASAAYAIAIRWPQPRQLRRVSPEP